jgi:MFS family permease
MNPSRLFKASCVALIVTAMSFALRTAAVGAWTTEFHLTNEQVGWVNGAAFWGFTLAMMFGGPLCDALGLRVITALAWIGHVVGILLTIFAWNYTSLYIATLIFGIANGSVEAVCNPLITTLFPTNKTTKLNHFHAWFPGGIVIGGLSAFVLAKAGLGWKPQFACMLIPLAIYGVMFLGQQMPKTERVQQGVSTGSMFGACLNPVFLLMVACMFLTAATEFGPQNWLPPILAKSGVSNSILILVWITGLMACGRLFAGAFVHRLAPMGMLTLSAVLSAVGIFTISKTGGGAMLFVGATVFAFGVCFFWPTMLGYVSENFPKTGALGLAIMGGAGMLSANFVLPLIGRWFDTAIIARIPAGQTADALSAAPPASDLGTTWMHIQADAGLEALGKVALLPAILVVVFAILLLTRKSAKSGAPTPAA